MKKPISVLFFLVLLQISAELSNSASVYESFLQCLSKNSNPSQINSIVYAQSNSSYSSVLKSYIRNLRFETPSTSKPIIIVTPKTIPHVQATVICTKTMKMQLKIRSGGHDYEGLSYISDVTPFVILDMFNLRSISIDMASETAWVQTGATLGELYYSIWQKSNVHGFPAGLCPTVGVGGHLGGGGYGYMLRKFGLTVDNVVDAQIVNVLGQFLDRKSMGEDLFWAIRGGGSGSFGVVISYKVNLVRVPEVNTVFRIERTLSQNATDIVFKWQQVVDKLDDRLFIRLLLQPTTSKGKTTVRVSFIAMFLGSGDELVSIMNTNLPELGTTRKDCIEVSWIDSMLWWSNFAIGAPRNVLLKRTPNSINFLKRKSDYVQTPISKNGLEGLWAKLIELGKIGMVFNAYGGKMSRIAADATPFPHRAGNIFKIQYSVSWSQSGVAAENKYMSQARSLYSYMTPFVSQSPRAAFLNYRDVDIGVNHHDQNSYSDGKVYGSKYFGGNFDRLVKVKSAVDPANFFRNEQSIPVLPS